MSIKRFKSFIAEEGAGMTPASEFEGMDSAGAEKPKKEQDFIDDHKMTVTKHPVAGDHQFNGDRREIRN